MTDLVTIPYRFYNSPFFWVYRVRVLNENSSVILIQDEYGPVKQSEDIGNALYAYVWGAMGMVVVLRGENVPELFGWLSVSTGFNANPDGCSLSDVVQS